MTEQQEPLTPAAETPASAPLPELAARVAVLEERTAPRPKTRLDRIKDWGGVVSLVLALAYTFPLGLWDRFIEPGKKRNAEEIAHLRQVVDQSIALILDGGRSLAGIKDSYFYDTVARAVNTRLYVLMSKNQPLFDRHKDVFTAPELLVIGNSFTLTGQVEAAQPFFVLAEQKAGADVMSRVEALRQRGKGLFMRGPGQDRAAARRLLSQALTTLENARSQQALVSHTMLSAEWALIEMIEGDWACGQQKLVAARDALARMAPFMNDQGNFVRLVETHVQALRPQPGQPATGC